MSRNAPWFQMWAAEFLADNYVDAMTAEQVGWFCLLLFRSWINTPQGYLANDKQLLARWCKFASDVPFDDVAKIVLDRFETTEDGQYIYHPKLISQVCKIGQTSEKRQLAGRMGGLAKARNLSSKTLANSTEKEKEVEIEEEEIAPPSTPKYVVPTNGEPPEGLNEREYALWFWEELQVPATRTTLPVAADAIRLIAKHESCSLYDAAKRMLSRAVEYQHDTHKPINQFWFTDGGHKASAAATKQPMQWVEREQ